MSRFAIEATFTAIDRMTAPVTQMEKATRALSTGIRADFAMMKNSFGNFKNSIFGNLMAYDLFKTAVFAVGGALKFTVNEARKLEDARAAFTPLVGGAEKASQLVDMLNIAAAQTPYVFEDIAKTAKQLLPVMDGDLNKTVETFKMLGDTAGGNAEKLDSITRGFTKAMLKGRVDMESLNMIAEAGVPIFTELATSMGYNKNNMTAFFKEISSGTVGTDKLIGAFKRMTSEGGIFFQGMIIASKTTSGVFSTMQDSISMTAAGIGDALLPVVKEIALEITDVATNMLKWVQSNKEFLKTEVRSWFESFKTGVGYIVDVIKFLYDMRDVIKVLIELWILYKAVQMAAFGISAVSGALNFLNTFKMAIPLLYQVSGATTLWELAQWKLNMAMSANLIGIIVTAISILVVWIYTAVKNWEDFGAAMLAAIGPVGWIVEYIMMISDYWTSITDSFSTGGILAGLKQIGLMLLDTILLPLQQILEIASSIPGIGSYAASGAEKLKAFRSETGMIGGRREVTTQSQQVASAINTNRTNTLNTTNTQVRDLRIVVDNKAGNSIDIFNPLNQGV